MKNTKFAYKVVKNNRKTNVVGKVSEKVSKLPAVANVSSVVSFILVSKIVLCFRECAKIIKIAEETGCLVEIASGEKSGDSSSILSLVNLGIGIDKSLVLTIKGERNVEAFHRVSKVIYGISDEETEETK